MMQINQILKMKGHCPICRGEAKKSRLAISTD